MSPILPILAAVAASLPPTAPPLSAALDASGVAGRLVVIDGSTAVPIPEVRRRVGGRPLTVQLRSGARVVAAPVGDDGLFAAELDADIWTIDGVASGALFEFLDPPREVTPRGGELACIGQLTLTLRDLGAEFGQATGSWSASDGCAELAGRLKPLTRGRRVRTRLTEAQEPEVRRSGWELLAGARTSFGWWSVPAEGGPVAVGEMLTATLTFGLNRPVTASGAFGLAASFTQATGEPIGDAPRTRNSVAAGVTWAPFGWVELMAGPQLHLDAGGLGAFWQARVGSEGLGMYLRVDYGGPGRVFGFALEIAPAWFLGGLL